MMHNYYVRLENITTELSNLIRNPKTEYYSKLATKLVNPSASAKTYWSIWKTFANCWKVPVIPPLLINNEFISNFKTKANYFNRFLNRQYTAISMDSSIPSSVNLATNETLTKTNFDEQLISKLTVPLNPNKPHGHDGVDGVSIRMLQMVISKPLSILLYIYIYIYIYIYVYIIIIIIYISCILKICYMWCANEIYYSQVKLS